jgi:hypothetical protein
MSRTRLKNPPVGCVLTPPGAADHHCDMKWLLSVLALSAALGFAAGCAPQEAFCPNTSHADAGGVCPIYGDDGPTAGVDMVNCPMGQFKSTDSSGNTVCLCTIGGGPPPCN